MEPKLAKRIEQMKAVRPRNKAAALDRLATDLGLMDNVIHVDFKAKRKIN